MPIFIPHHRHPNVPYPYREWSEEQTLHVAVAYSNPYRWNTRRQLFNNFRFHMEQSPNVQLHVAELAYGDRPFEVSQPGDLQMRTHSELFHKENILNECIKRFDTGWKYGAYLDADFTFNRYDWALETIHQLQHHAFVQPFSMYTDLSANTYGGSRPQRTLKSFAATYIDNGHKVPDNYQHSPAGWPVAYDTTLAAAAPWVPVGATGGAWAFTRHAYEQVGGLLDVCILGHADWFMAFGMVAAPTQGEIAASKFHSAYTDAITAWQERAQVLKKNVGVVDNFAVHHFHGAKKNRGYGTRDQILVAHNFNPHTDLRRNAYGIYELVGNKPDLRDAIRRYFVCRNEDDPTGA